MSDNKKIKLEFSVDEKIFNEAVKVFDLQNLSVEKAIEIYFEHVVAKQYLPFDSGEGDELSNKDNYMKAIVDVLAGHYDYIYYVDLKDGTYLEFNTKNAYRVLEIGETGKDFFADVLKNIPLLIHFDDRAKLRNALQKDTLLNNLKEKGTFSIVYRMIITSTPQYYMMVVSYVGEDRDKLIIEVRNVDETIRRERQQARELERISSLAHIDSLTKCLNYLAFQEERDKLSLKIKNNEHNFALLMCDLNDLKNINDDAGHLVGDEYLVRAADVIRNIFHNSKTFRIGGDEFLVVLEGEDYKNRHELIEILKSESEANLTGNGPVIAVGLADLDKGTRDFSSLFMEADQKMYEHKHLLKEMANK